MGFNIRNQMLEAAQIEVIDEVWTGQVAGPSDAWRLIVGGNVVPSATVSRRVDGEYLDEVDASWGRLGREGGMFGPNGEFLVSVGGAGLGDLPWARVRCEPASVMVHHLAAITGEPEFVAMSVDGTVVCGVTTEEYDVWIILKHFRNDAV
ncbi:hypothetical protein QRX60_34755 [Amycolatopsis mongoliensis]|uniref:Uncharacterized protein n=1 Tax=Amycolatopsis mongoliensis TaxID=715475 RepID=A0A9Y2JIF0_9PSEU|nr:hypothetical protein [Amycolatopsis sp. 4-36]WIX99185.1 hypothetical protein QRX60_34755 [Amycolatopsis sp. 4-36]